MNKNRQHKIELNKALEKKAMRNRTIVRDLEKFLMNRIIIDFT